MAKSLFGVEIDQNLLSQYHPKGPGLPDPSMVLVNGRPDDSVLESLFRMNRPERKRESKLPRRVRIVGLHDWRSNRLHLMVDGLKLAEKLVSSTTTTAPAWRSWEMLTLEQIHPMWVGSGSGMAARGEKLTEAERALLDTWLTARIDGLVVKGKFGERREAFLRGRSYYPALLGMVVLVWEKLQQWDSLGEKEQLQVAEAVYALSTPFGHDFFGVFITACPGLQHYYQGMREINRIINSPGTPPAEMTEEDEAVAEADAPLEMTAAELYALIATVAEEGRRSGGDLQHAERIEAVLRDNLPRLKERYALSEGRIRETLLACIAELEAVGSDIPLSDFENEDFLYAFRTAWLEYFNRKLTEEVQATFLNDVAQNRFAQAFEFKETFRGAALARDAADEASREISARLQSASFKEKRDLRTRLDEAEAEASHRKQDYRNLEADGYNLLLPPGALLDTLAEGHNVELTPAVYHLSSIGALQGWTWSRADAASVTPTAPIEEAPPPLTELEAAVAEPGTDNVLGTEPAAKVTVQANIAATTAEVEDVAKEEPALPQGVAEPEEDASLNQYLSQPEEAAARLTQTRHPIAAENVAMLWLRKGELPLAWKTLEVAGRVYKDSRLFPLELIHAAYMGMHVWRGDNAAVIRTLQNMNQLPQDEIHEWMDRRPGGKLVPYLVFAATFQPSAFIGNLTSAPRLLSSVADNFDEPVARLIEALVSFSDHSNRLDVDTLREQPKLNEKDARRALAADIVKWHDIIVNKQTGWAAGRHAMRACLDYPEFRAMYQAITGDDAESISAVQEFVDRFRDVEEQNHIMHTEVAKVQSNGAAAVITGAARQWFRSNLDRAVEIADAWLEIYAQQGGRSSEISKFARKFMTMTQAALTHVEDRLRRDSDLEQKAGQMIVRDALHNVCRLADGTLDPRWKGQRVLGWSAWPGEWLAGSEAADEPDAQLQMLGKLLADDLPLAPLIEDATARRNFRHAYLLSQHRKDVTGEDNSEQAATIERLFGEDLRSCSLRCNSLKSTLDNANVASLIDDEEHYQLKSEVEHVQEQLVGMQVLDDVRDVHATLDGLEDQMKMKFAEKTAELRTEFEELVTRARVERGVEWLPEVWLDQVKAALEQNDTTVAEELLEHLKSALRDGTPLEGASGSGTELLKTFLETEPFLYEQIRIPEHAQKLTRHLATMTVPGLDFDAIPSLLKKGLEDLMALNRRLKHLDKSLYDSLQHVLKSLGMDLSSPTFNAMTEKKSGWETAGKFARLHLPVKPADTGRGYVFFTEGSNEQMVNLILAMPDWTVSDLQTMLKDHVSTIHNRTIVLSGRPLSNEERNAFARLCKQDKMTLYLVDPVVLSVLCGMKLQDSERIKTFLKLCLPWTYSNPYTAEHMRPAVQEMRYGRRDAIRSLAARDGAAMIFGGRQMGKSTLLREAQRVYHNPEINHFAHWHQMDGNLDRAKLSDDELATHRNTVWSHIYSDAAESGFIKAKGSLTVDEKFKEVRDFFQRNSTGALMVCLDEIDPILNLDAAHGFPIFRELSSLVSESKGRFKVIIAGLENVRRFADAPNYPLHQLGSAIPVTIMSPSESLQLIKEPIGFLGYAFEHPLLLNRILVETNRHPGLIHIFCHALVKRMADREKGQVGSITITGDDIEQVRNDPWVKGLIRDRFDITLTLDLRYKLIAYSVIEQGLATFQASRAKAIVEEWAPEIFKRMTGKQFEAFLDELCGLGVFQSMQRSESAREYALRNANILNLVGGRKDIGEKLLATLEQMKENDPTTGHAILDGGRPSPLMLRDEALLISEDRKGEPADDDGTVRAKASKYSVGVVIGSEALGLNATWMSESLVAIGTFEPPVFPGAPRDRYKPAVKKDTDFAKAGDFKKTLVDSVLKVRAMTEPVMFFIEVTGDLPLSHTLDLIDVAHEARMEANAKRMRVRVMFLLSPKALWQWMSAPSLTREREVQQPFIGLDLWRDTALVHLLNNMNLENTTTAQNELIRYSQRWYLSIDRLLDARNRKVKNSERVEGLKVSDFGQAYQPLLEAKPKSQEEFLTKAGVMATPWALPLLRRMAEHTTFEVDDVGMELMEIDGAFENADHSIPVQWLLRLHLIEALRMEPSREDGKRPPTRYKVTPSIANAIRVAFPEEVAEPA